MCLTYYFPFFSAIARLFDVASCIFKLKSFNCSYSTLSHMEIVKKCIPENNIFGQHDHTNEFIDSFRFCVSLIAVCKYL